MKKINLVGRRFARLRVLSELPDREHGQVRWLCRCDCGTETSALGGHLRAGNVQSCGCLKYDSRNATHGLKKHRLYDRWTAMMARCYSPENKSFADYGGRGISVCQRWQSVAHFIADNESLAGPGLTMDRIKNDRNYEPGNVRWVDETAQANNKRNNHLISYQGRRLTISQWAKELGIARRTLSSRLDDLGWPIAKAFSFPV